MKAELDERTAAAVSLHASGRMCDVALCDRCAHVVMFERSSRPDRLMTVCAGMILRFSSPKSNDPSKDETAMR